MTSGNGRFSAITTFIAGGLIGTGVALLFAPQSGRRTRREIRYLGEKAFKRSEAIRSDALYTIENLLDEFSDKLKESLGRGQRWTEDTKLQAQQALEMGKTRLEKEIEHFKRAGA